MYSATNWNPNIIRICIRPKIWVRILFVFVHVQNSGSEYYLYSYSSKNLGPNIIRIRIRIFWKYEYYLLKYSATYIKETEDKNMNDTAFMVKKYCWIAPQIHIKFDTTPALPFISLPPVHQCTIETSQELRKLPATSYLENERWQQRLCWKITSYQCVLFCSPICAFGKTNSQHLRDEIIRSTDQMGRKMIQYWFNRINTELRKWRWKWNENSM